MRQAPSVGRSWTVLLADRTSPRRFLMAGITRTAALGRTPLPSPTVRLGFSRIEGCASGGAGDEQRPRMTS